MQGIAMYACIPMRKKPGGQQELVSQVLFGEAYDILKKGRKFTYIQTHYDGYEGWVDNDTVSELQADIELIPPVSNTCAITTVQFKTGTFALIVPGASSFYPNRETKDSFIINGKEFTISNGNKFEQSKGLFDQAMNYLHAPYLWGGRTVFGIDSSGLVQNAMKMKGHAMPRDAYQQVKEGKAIESLVKAKKGDLAFFANTEGRINHVGILDGNGKIIHSAGNVKIELITEEGILNADSGKIYYVLHSVRRME
jgi:gamma-D-glutamyl-L-lysine dipeptidyl-peptidase